MGKSIEIHVLGNIWQPGMGECSMTYTIPDYDARRLFGKPLSELAGDELNEALELWLDKNTGDFQKINAWEAVFVETKSIHRWLKSFDKEELDRFLDLNPDDR